MHSEIPSKGGDTLRGHRDFCFRDQVSDTKSSSVSSKLRRLFVSEANGDFVSEIEPCFNHGEKSPTQNGVSQ